MAGSSFIPACDCPRCGNVCIPDGVVADFTVEKDRVVRLQNFSHMEWHCDKCGIDFGTCEVENIIEEF